jgi:tetratricopeptide (TPR) repeat protein
MPRLLAAWGKRQPTERVLTQVLGTSIARLNQTFSESLRVRFARFKAQYLPLKKPTSLAVATEDLARAPDSPQSIAAFMYAQLLAGDLEKARDTQRRSASRIKDSPDFLWLDSLLLMAEGQTERALLKLDEMVAAGFDGYFIQLQRALLSRQLGRTNEETKDLERAHHFHPTATEPLYRLVAKAREARDEVTELKYLSDLCQLEESDAKLHRRHVELRLKLGQKQEAWAAAETLLYVAPLTSSTHELTARAALALNNLGRATRELNIAAELASPLDRQVLEGWIGLVRRGQKSLPPNPNRPTEEP